MGEAARIQKQLQGKNVIVSVPTYDHRCHVGTCMSLMNMSEGGYKLNVRFFGSSLLTQAFNNLWCNALNTGADWFVMLHADIRVLTPFWVDAIIREAIRSDADILSAVVPIKAYTGLTSTAIGSKDPDDQWLPLRRLTMKEVYKLPPTFTIEDTDVEDGILLVNTGVMAVNFRKDWVKNFRFNIKDMIYQNGQGQWDAICAPEDWNMSRDAYQLGAKLVATRKIQVQHHGTATWGNDQDWGSFETDEESLNYRKNVVRHNEVA